VSTIDGIGEASLIAARAATEMVKDVMHTAEKLVSSVDAAAHGASLEKGGPGGGHDLSRSPELGGLRPGEAPIAADLPQSQPDGPWPYQR
jgi:hypothetical protein